MNTFERFFGRHKLQGVERTYYTTNNGYSVVECEAVKFTLDGETYMVYCDPSDGYRSYCSDIIICDEKSRFPIPDVDVLCIEKEGDKWDSSSRFDMMKVLNANTGKTIFEIGTDYYDEYYPMYRFDYYPENI